jgi:hypothetical protein
MPLDAAALDAVVGAARARRLSAVSLISCALSAASAPALVRLLGGGALQQLGIFNEDEGLLDAAVAALLGAALRANCRLTSFSFMSVDIWHDAAVGAALVNALTAHRSLESVDLSYNDASAHAAAAGTALGALIAADAPTLHSLNVDGCFLTDVGLGPLVDALASNTHLRSLDISHNEMTEAFARSRLLPAVRANRSLMQLSTGVGFPSAREAEALVAARAAR